MFPENLRCLVQKKNLKRDLVNCYISEKKKIVEKFYTFALKSKKSLYLKI